MHEQMPASTCSYMNELQRFLVRIKSFLCTNTPAHRRRGRSVGEGSRQTGYQLSILAEALLSRLQNDVVSRPGDLRKGNDK